MSVGHNELIDSKIDDRLRRIMEMRNIRSSEVVGAVEEDSGGKNTIEEKRVKIHPLNIILYGAPGTGKTFSTAEMALAIIENKKTP